MTDPIYIYNKSLPNYYFHPGHPMKPIRLKYTLQILQSNKTPLNYLEHSLTNTYNNNNNKDKNYKKNIFDDKINSYSNVEEMFNDHSLFNDDCPNFDGVKDYARALCECSLLAGMVLCNNKFNTTRKVDNNFNFITTNSNIDNNINNKKCDNSCNTYSYEENILDHRNNLHSNDMLINNNYNNYNMIDYYNNKFKYKILSRIKYRRQYNKYSTGYENKTREKDALLNNNLCYTLNNKLTLKDFTTNNKILNNNNSNINYNNVNNKNVNKVINHAGGLHHARKSSFAGFCYLNDITILILYLKRYYTKILYVDIDVHHGDGVEEAFRLDNNVHTLSLHQYGNDFFPRTGSLLSNSKTVTNVPLRKGAKIDDVKFVFFEVLEKIFEVFCPQILILQTGADSLKFDRLGQFNLELIDRVQLFKKIVDKNIPTIVLGGGGYVPLNVANCWALEAEYFSTKNINKEILKFDLKKNGTVRENIENFNSKSYLENIKSYILNILTI